MKTVETFHRFCEVAPRSVKARGHLLEFLQRQQSGLSGNFREQGYPYNTVMWDGEFKVQFREHEDHGRPLPVPGINAWWPYEQISYLLDGLERLGILLDNQENQDLFKRNLDAILERKSADGRLGGPGYGFESEWPLAVFFRGVKAYCEANGDEQVIRDFQTHYLALDEKALAGEFRYITNLEGMLIIYGMTGDRRLLEKAVRCYELHNKLFKQRDSYNALYLDRMLEDQRIVMHGVSLSEELKLPVLLYLYSGEARYLQAARHALQTILDNHEQMTGVPSTNEFTTGRDPLQGYESCVITDFSWTLGYFLMAEAQGQDADLIEKIIYNALPGSITKDFTALQYFSSANQVVSTAFSNHSLFLHGTAPLRQYRPDHFAQCCAGNIHRAMPNFVLRMWMLDRDNGQAPAAVMYGPSALDCTYDGVQVHIEEKTLYPYSEEVRFEFTLDQALEMPFTLRIPQWCSNAALLLDGRKLDYALEPGKFVTIRELWQNKSELVLKLPMHVERKSDRQWQWFERGALVYSCNIPHEESREKAQRFTPRSFVPVGDWNFVPANDGLPEVVENPNPDYVLDDPPVKLRLKVRRISNYDSLDRQFFTPDVPLFYKVQGEVETIDLVPFGSTITRITAFPDLVERQAVPVVSARAIGPYPYNWRLPMEVQQFEPEFYSDWEFIDKTANAVQINRDGYVDLVHHFRCSQQVMAYLQFRIWAEESGKATLALAVSDGAIGYLNGQKILCIEPQTCGEFMAPFWFEVNLQAGYNFLRLKVVDSITPEQFRDAWGAKLQVFKTK